MKSFIDWIKGSKSDFLLFIIVLVLLNLVGSYSFFRIDLTAAKSYSLSDASTQLVQTLEEPLSVKVFFSSNLPFPYNTVGQYVTDLLLEYGGSGNENFSWEVFNMDDPKNETIARNYGLGQISIQEVTDTEVGFKNVWMGLAFVYADRIEILNGIQSLEGLEYSVTTTMARMINATSTLSGLEGKVDLTLFLTPELGDLNIANFSSVDSAVVDAFSIVNRGNMDRISFERINPSVEEIPGLVQKYGIQELQWELEDGSSEVGVIGLVLEYGESFRLVPLQMVNQLFGGYAIAGLDTLEGSINESLQSLFSKSTDIGYLVGHGERSLSDPQAGAANFAVISSDLYDFKELSLVEDDIPANITTLIINGPKGTFTDAELYKIDQFVLWGGNLALFLDPLNEVFDQSAAYGMPAQSPPQYIPIDTGLQKLLDTYGIAVTNSYVMDTTSYSEYDQRIGEKIDFYYVPLVHQDRMAREHPISANLSYVVFPQVGAIDITIPEDDKNRTATVLAKTTDEAWRMSEGIILNPMYLTPPSNKDEQKAENISVLVEGIFDSAFDSAPVQEIVEGEDSSLVTSSHLNSSVQKGRVFIVGSSAVTTGMVLNPQQLQPIGLFIRNALDYLNGSADLALMRTKGLSLNVLEEIDPDRAAGAKSVNQYGLPLLVALIGFVVWRIRSLRRRKIYERYNRSNNE